MSLSSILYNLGADDTSQSQKDLGNSLGQAGLSRQHGDSSTRCPEVKPVRPHSKTTSSSEAVKPRVHPSVVLVGCNGLQADHVCSSPSFYRYTVHIIVVQSLIVTHTAMDMPGHRSRQIRITSESSFSSTSLVCMPGLVPQLTMPSHLFPPIATSPTPPLLDIVAAVLPRRYQSSRPTR